MSRVLAIFGASLICSTCLSANESETALVAPQEILLSIPEVNTAAEPVVQTSVQPAAQPKVAPAPIVVKTPEVSVSPFTGKIKGKKVRMRLRPDTDSQVIKELNKGDLLCVVGEKGDFWAVQAPAGIKAYVFRSFVLDNVVEGKRVNVRLEPSTEAPIIGHLNTGDKIHGTVCEQHNKWIEIAPPASTRFYVAKELVENVGGPEVKAQADKRFATAEQLLDASTLLGKAELKKSYDDMDIDRVTQGYKTIINEYSDFSDLVEKAKEQLASLQEAYVQKRLTAVNAKPVSSKKHGHEEDAKESAAHATLSAQAATDKMKMWEPVEEAMYLSWAAMNEDKDLDQFYDEQKVAAVPLSGILEAYSSPVKNKPGDFIIRDKDRDLPVAYVYSTKVNLQQLVGKKVTLLAAPRANNNFAFPAYFVLGVE
jgi:hypothetical protein